MDEYKEILEDIRDEFDETEDEMPDNKAKAKIPTPSKFTGKPSECTAAWMRQWKQQVDDYFHLTQFDKENDKMIFLPNCLDDGP